MENYSTHSDLKLLELLRCDDEAAFTEIYKRYWDKLYALGLLKLKSAQGAEDVVQEVFSDLWNRRNVISVEHLSAYLAAAVKYSVIRKISRMHKESVVIGKSYTSSEFNMAEFRFLQRLMENEINRLPEKCRIVFQYSRQEDLSNKEIARKMNISQKSVEKHITTALRKLRINLRHTFQSFF